MPWSAGAIISRVRPAFDFRDSFGPLNHISSYRVHARRSMEQTKVRWLDAHLLEDCSSNLRGGEAVAFDTVEVCWYDESAGARKNSCL